MSFSSQWQSTTGDNQHVSHSSDDEGSGVEGAELGGSESGSVEEGEGDDDEEEEDGSDLVVLDPNHVSTECALANRHNNQAVMN